MKPTVYLAGPITGLNYNGCTEWREEVTAALAPGIKAFSPMRAKAYLKSIAEISGTGVEYAHMGVLSQARSVMTRDRFDATRCDVLLVNLLGAKAVSIGTVMEMAWADLARTPIVCVMEKTGNQHEHMMVNEAIGFRVETLDEAVHVINSILL
jgi:nucleoside 2-deoxyribosyltransferase